jgi:hypothetical protein
VALAAGPPVSGIEGQDTGGQAASATRPESQRFSLVDAC